MSQAGICLSRVLRCGHYPTGVTQPQPMLCDQVSHPYYPMLYHDLLTTTHPITTFSLLPHHSPKLHHYYHLTTGMLIFTQDCEEVSSATTVIDLKSVAPSTHGTVDDMVQDIYRTGPGAPRLELLDLDKWPGVSPAA